MFIFVGGQVLFSALFKEVFPFSLWKFSEPHGCRRYREHMVDSLVLSHKLCCLLMFSEYSGRENRMNVREKGWEMAAKAASRT